MNDWSTFAVTLASDPLAGGFFVIVAGVIVSRLLFRQQSTWRAVARVVILVMLTVLLLRGGIVPYEPMQPTGVPFRDAINGMLKVAWWLLAAWFLVALVERFVVVERRPREGKLVRDLLTALIYLAALFAIIAYVFNRPLQGLLATSGAIAIILGLALQSTLNDVFSGLVLNFSRPFRLGDQINIDGSTEGQVVEMNWRATHVLTGRRDLAILPNSTIAKSKIVNLNFPSGIHCIVVSVRLISSPGAGKAVLEMVLLNAKPVLSVPHPTIRVVSIDEGQAEFEMTAFVDGLGVATGAQNELFDLIYRHAAACGIRLSPPKDSSVRMVGTDAPIARRTRERVLDIVSIFASLTPEERAAVATKLKRATYDPGDVVVEPGTVLRSLYFVGRGVLSVTGDHGGTETEALRFGPGDHYGEIGLLTGSAATVTITALASSIVYELAMDDLAPILETNPQFAQELSHALAERQAAGRALIVAGIDRSEPHGRLSNWFFDHIHKWLELETLR